MSAWRDHIDNNQEFLLLLSHLSPLLSVRQAPAGKLSGQKLTLFRERNRTTDLLLYLEDQFP